MWPIDQATFATADGSEFVYIEAETQPYQGELQPIIQNIDPVEPSVEELADLMPMTSRNIDEMYAEVAAALDPEHLGA